MNVPLLGIMGRSSKPGAHMPGIDLKGPELESLISYLESLR
jgi:hypothetical protein